MLCQPLTICAHHACIMLMITPPVIDVPLPEITVPQRIFGSFAPWSQPHRARALSKIWIVIHLGHLLVSQLMTDHCSYVKVSKVVANSAPLPIVLYFNSAFCLVGTIDKTHRNNLCAEKTVCRYILLPYTMVLAPLSMYMYTCMDKCTYIPQLENLVSINWWNCQI